MYKGFVPPLSEHKHNACAKYCASYDLKYNISATSLMHLHNGIGGSWFRMMIANNNILQQLMTTNNSLHKKIFIQFRRQNNNWTVFPCNYYQVTENQ